MTVMTTKQIFQGMYITRPKHDSLNRTLPAFLFLVLPLIDTKCSLTEKCTKGKVNHPLFFGQSKKVLGVR